MISIIIPCKEEPYLPTLISEIKNVMQESYEVLIQTEKGLGYAVKCGIERSKGEIICVLDADGSHSPKYIPYMINQVMFYDIVIGSRYKDGNTKDSFTRKVISRFYCEFAKELFRLNVNDSMSGFFVVKREVFEKYPITIKGYKILLECLVKSRQDFVVKEYPIVFEQRKLGKSNASIKQGFQTLWFITKLYWRQKHDKQKNKI